MNKKISNPKSLTHQHIFLIVDMLIQSNPIQSNINLLDAGCGDGNLIEYLHRMLNHNHPDKTIKIYGFDVVDHGVQDNGFLEKTSSRLSSNIPEIDWKNRIKGINQDSLWNYPEDLKFDYIISNQVLEHVKDKNSFFTNVHQELQQNGYFIALNPLKSCLWEGHIYLPIAHWINSYFTLYWYIKFCSKLGLGKFKNHHKTSNISLDDYTEKHTDYILFWTSYATEKEMHQLAKQHNLRSSFAYSLDFYLLKLREIFHLSPPTQYNPSKTNSSLIKILKYVSSVTFIAQKRNTY